MQLLPLPSIYFKFNPGSNTELTSDTTISPEPGTKPQTPSRQSNFRIRKKWINETKFDEI